MMEHKCVSWTVFAWAIGIMTLAFTFVITNQIAMSESQNNSKVEYARIQEKLINIEVTLAEIKLTLKEKK